MLFRSELAYFDPLVGLPNRAAAIDHLEQQRQRQAFGGQVLATLDLDRFAETNDMFGHHFGDLLLKAVALRLVRELPAGSYVARVAGNTFAVFGPAQAVHPDALHALLDRPIEVDGTTRRLSVSMAFVPCDDIEVAQGSDLLKDASIAMKHARAAGPGRSAYYTRAIGADSRERTRLLHGLHRAFDHDRLFMVYQPQVDLDTRRVVGAEALVRWQHPQLGMLFPDEFIPVAEKTGLIGPLTLYMLEAALTQRSAWAEAGLHLGMAVNVAKKTGRPVLFFSLEMGATELTQRIISAEAQVESDRLRTGKLTDNDWSKIVHATGRLDIPLYIDDTPQITVVQIRQKIRRVEATEALKPALVVVDYLQLMGTGKTSTESRQVEISEISRNLKLLAREFNVPVVALSQLSRNLEQRADKRPQLSDLRESGAIEQDADTVMFLFREEVSNPDLDLEARGWADVTLEIGRAHV